MNDTRADQLNQYLVQKLLELNHIQSQAVAAAFLATPRHFFTGASSLDETYENRPIALKQEGEVWVSSISQPSMIAIMLEQLELRPNMRVLEIGAGSGYNAALMAHLVGEGGRVITLDIDQDLVEGARANLATAHVSNVEAICADGGLGYADGAPYDRIILTVGAADISPHWIEQLAAHGRLLLPLELDVGQFSVAFDPVVDQNGLHLESRSVKECAFIRLRGAYAARGTAPLEVAPGVALYAPTAAARLTAAKVLTWLRQQPADWPTGVLVTQSDFWRGLGLWLALHEPDMAGLRISKETPNEPPFPLLHLFADDAAAVNTVLLSSQDGVAALLRAPTRASPPTGQATAEPFELWVRQFGADERPARRLAALVQAWERAGRPAVDRLQLAAYPKSAGAPPQRNTFWVEKPNTWLLLEWR